MTQKVRATLVLLRVLRSLMRFDFKKQLHTKATNVLSDRYAGGYIIITPYLSNHSLLSGWNISLVTVHQVSLTDFYIWLS